MNLRDQKIIISGLVSYKEESESAVLAIIDLVQKAGGKVVGQLIQRRGVSRSSKPGGSAKLDQPLHSGTFISQGKAEELKDLCREMQCNAVVFINLLNKHQQEILWWDVK